jgi:hypothetical protein
LCPKLSQILLAVGQWMDEDLRSQAASAGERTVQVDLLR